MVLTSNVYSLISITQEEGFDSFNFKGEVFLDESLSSRFGHVVIDDLFNHAKHTCGQPSDKVAYAVLVVPRLDAKTTAKQYERTCR